MNRILVATDGSEGGDRAVDYAARWAKTDGAELLIVNVIGGYGLPNKILDQPEHNIWLKEALTSASADMLVRARETATRIGVGTVHLESRAGEIAQTIINIAKEEEADAIVVGKRGIGQITGLLLGSTSQKLASLASLPVTIVP